MALLKSLFFIHLLCAYVVNGHGGVKHGGAEGEKENPNWKYAQRHMAKEHHIDTFDARSFFALHDLNSDGILDREEIEAIYGVHHIYSQKLSKDDKAHQEKADHVVSVVLNVMDKNGDGKITPEEFEAAGLDSLPSFDGLGADGHHYDVESEFFLHHEEEFHSTPETQTDEAYNHPEDLEHFAQHEEIERREAAREAQFQGISVEEALAAHNHEAAPANAKAVVDTPADGQVPMNADPHQAHDQVHADAQSLPTVSSSSSAPRVTREVPPEKQDPAVRFRKAKDEGMVNGEWGAGDSGYKIPTTPGERMRKNVPYKYKFRRNWGDF